MYIVCTRGWIVKVALTLASKGTKWMACVFAKTKTAVLCPFWLALLYLQFN